MKLRDLNRCFACHVHTLEKPFDLALSCVLSKLHSMDSGWERERKSKMEEKEIEYAFERTCYLMLFKISIQLFFSSHFTCVFRILFDFI